MEKDKKNNALIITAIVLASLVTVLAILTPFILIGTGIISIGKLIESIPSKENKIDLIDGWYIISDDDNMTCDVYGLDLSNLTSDFLVLPTEIYGYKVRGFYPDHSKKCRFCNTSYDLNKIKKVFVPDSVYGYRAHGKSCFPPLKAKKIFLSVDSLTYMNGFYGDDHLLSDYSSPEQYPFTSTENYICVPESALNSYISRYENMCPEGIIIAANVSFLYNYDGAPNGGYCWIDHLESGESLKIIPEPTREGYNFEGWFSDAECIAAFDKDTFVMQGAQKVHIYAKWTAVV